METSIDLIPSPGIIIISPLEETEQDGVIIPDSVALKDQVGIVLAVGPEIHFEHRPEHKRGTWVKPGDKVVHLTWSNLALTHKNGKKLRFIRFEDVVARYTTEEDNGKSNK